MAKEKKDQLPEDIQEVVIPEVNESNDSESETTVAEVNKGVVEPEVNESNDSESETTVAEVNKGVVEPEEGVVSDGFVRIRVLVALAGRFLLPDNPGSVITIDKNQGIEIVESGYGEYVDL